MPTGRSILDPFNGAYEFNNFLSKRDEILGGEERFKKYIAISQRDFDTAMQSIRDVYANSEDPNEFKTRTALGQIVGNYMHIDPKVATENIEDLYYTATGYRGNVNGMGEHLANTFNSGGSSILAGVKTLGFLLSNLGETDESFEQKWQEFKDTTLSRYAKTYRSDLYLDKHGMIADFLTAAAGIAPSMIPTLALSGIVALSSLATGGTAGAVAGAGIGSFIKSYSSLSTAEKAVAGGTLLGRTLLTGVMEAGSTTLDMLEMGFDKDVILPTSAIVGLLNGAVENIGSIEDKLTAPIRMIVDSIGRNRANDIFHEAVSITFKGLLKDYLSSLVTEPAEEVLQELNSMLGVNIALAFQNSTGKKLEDVIPYSASDIGNALYDTAVQTLKGTMVLGAGGALLNTAGGLTFGELGYNVRANKNTERTTADGKQATRVVNTRNVHRPSSEGVKPSGKVPAMDFVNIGGEYYVMNPTAEQNYVLRNSGYVYGNVVNYSPNWANNTISTYNGSVTFETANNGLKKAFENGDLKGYAYVRNEDGTYKEVPSSEAEFVAVESEAFEGISLFPITNDGGLSVSDFESNAFGKVYDKISESKEERKTEYSTDDELNGEEDLDNEADMEDFSAIDSPIKENAETFNDEVKKTLNKDFETDVEQTISELEKDLDTENEIITEREKSESNIKEDRVTDTVEKPIPTESFETTSEIEEVVGQEENGLDREAVTEKEKNSGSETIPTPEKAIENIISEKDKPSVEKFRRAIRNAYKNTPIGKNRAISDAVVNASVAVAKKFADAQGISLEDFVNGIPGINSSDSNEAVGGWYDVSRKLIYLTKNASPTTFIHELAHHFLNTLPDGKLKEAITKIYRKDYEKDGNTLGKNVMEKFSKDLEKYIYLRKTSNSNLRNVFENLYQLARTLWNQFSNKSRLSAESKLLFDYIFNDSLSDEKNLNNLTEAMDIAGNRYVKNRDMAKKAERSSKTKEELKEERRKLAKEQGDAIGDKRRSKAIEDARKIQEEAKIQAETVRQNLEHGSDNLTGDLIETEQINENLMGEPIDWIDYASDFNFSEIEVEKEKNDSYARSISSYTDELTGAINTGRVIGVGTAIEDEADNGLIELTSINKNGIQSVINKALGLNSRTALAFFIDKHGNIFVRMRAGLQKTDSGFGTYEFRGRKAYWTFIPVSEAYADPDVGLVSLKEDYESAGMDTEGVFDNDNLSELAVPDPKIVADSFLKNFATLQNDYALKKGDKFDNVVLYDAISKEEISDSDADMYASIVLNELSGKEISDLLSKFRSSGEQKTSIEKRFNDTVDSYLKDNGLEDNEENRNSYLNKIANDMYGFDSFSEIGNVELADFLYRYDKSITSKLSGFEQTVRSKILESMASMISYAEESYSFVGRELSEGFKSTEQLNTAISRLSEIYSRAKKHASSAVQFKANLKAIMDVDDIVFKDFIKLMEHGISMSKDEAKYVLRRFVSNDGNLNRVMLDTASQNLNSPLIYLLDYANTKGKTDDHFVGNQGYVSASQNLLRDTYNKEIFSESEMSMNLVDLISKLSQTMGDGVLADFFKGYKITASMSDAIVEQINNIVAKDREVADRLIVNLREKDKQLSDINLHITNLKERYMEELNALKEKNKTTKDELKALKEKYTKKLNALKAKYDIDALVKERNELRIKVKEQQAYFNAIANNPKLNLTNQIRATYSKYFRDLANKYSKGDSRGGSLIKKFIDLTKPSRKNGFVLSINVFDSPWQGYDMEPIKQFAIKYMGLEEKDGNYVLNKGLRDLTLEELGTFEDVVKNFMDEANTIRQDLVNKSKDDFSKFQKALIKSVFKHGGIEVKEGTVEEMLRSVNEEIRPGSNTEYDRNNSRFRGLARDTEILYNLTRRISPELTEYLFLGRVNGTVSTESLNTLTDMEQRAVQERVKNFYELTASKFGIKPEQVRSRINELFSDKTFKLGSMSVNEFIKKNNLSIGTIMELDDGKFYKQYSDTLPERFHALENYLLNNMLPLKKKDAKDSINLPTPITSSFDAYFASFDTDSTSENDATYSIQKLMGIYEFAKQEDLINTLIQSTSAPGTGNNIPLGNLLWVINQFENNPEFTAYREIADAMQADLAGKFSDLSDVYYVAENKVLDQVAFYSTAFREGGDLPSDMKLEIESAFGINDEATQRQSTANINETKKRTGGNRPLKLDYVNNYFKAVQDQEHYLTWAVKMKEYRDMFASNGDFAKAIRAMSDISKKDLDTVLSKIQKNISLIARNNTYSVDFASNFLNSLRGNMAKAVLWANLSASLQNIPGYINTLNDMSLGRSFKGLIGFLSNYRENKAMIDSLSPQMRERRREELYTATTAMRTSKGKIDSAISKVFGDNITNKMKHGIYKILEVGVDIVQKTEDFVAYAMWWAYYQNNINVKFKDSASDPNFIRLCAEDATQHVMNFLPTQNVKDSSLIFTSNDSGVRDILLFTSQLNKIFNIYYGAGADFWHERNIRNFAHLLRVWGTTTALITATAAISGRFINSGDDDDDEDGIGEDVRTVLAELASLIPIAGGAIRDLINNDFFMKQNPATAVWNLAKVIRKEPDDRTENQLSNAWIRFYEQTAQFLGWPSSTVSKVYYAIRDQNAGEIINSDWGNFDILSWGD